MKRHLAELTISLLALMGSYFMVSAASAAGPGGGPGVCDQPAWTRPPFCSAPDKGEPHTPCAKQHRQPGAPACKDF